MMNSGNYGVPKNLPLHHVGIIQPTESAALALMALLGLEEDFRGFVPKWSALCIFTRKVAGSPIEFVVPDGGPLAKFNKGLGGLHHIALEVTSLDDLAHRLSAAGMKLLETEHVKGAGQFFCNFLSPIYTRGITIEFVELIRET
jgi:catechol 2,3-dioxygenase-like lactoylglutathione lyase family enzyme